MKNKILYFPKEGVNDTSPTSAGVPVVIQTIGAEGGKLLSVINIPNTGASPGAKVKLKINGGLLVEEETPFPSTNLLDFVDLPVDGNGNKYLNLPSGTTIEVEHPSFSSDYSSYYESY